MQDNIIVCTCGCKLFVIDSRPVNIGELITMRRARKCKSCGRIFHTMEIPEDIVKEIYEED